MCLCVRLFLALLWLTDYYGIAIGALSTSIYYTTTSKYFIEGNLFYNKSDKLLLSMQSKITNPTNIEKSSKKYTEILVEEIKKMRERGKK